MNLIREDRLRGILLAVQCFSLSLADEIRQLRNSFDELPTSAKPDGGTYFKTFTTPSPVPRELAEEVLRTLEIFNRCETGRNYRGLGGQTSADLVEAWQRFIS